jgi:hypothetical protein
MPRHPAPTVLKRLPVLHVREFHLFVAIAMIAAL